ncbi:MAG: hypothetical protein IPK19_16000 [Chloroflexi bacterium]|nr:hypothetical protein [Chloroflexota bacterium]
MSLLVRFRRDVTPHPVPRLLALLCLALGLSLFTGAPANAACPASFPVTVPASDTARLIEVINCANAVPTNDVINLTNSTYMLTTSYISDDGFPPIATTATGGTLVINGNGATIARSSALGTPDFRLFYINSGANLTLNRVTLTNGRSGDGGAILNHGVLTVSDSTLRNNNVVGSFSAGGAIDNFTGTLTLVRSTLSGNSAADYGGAISNNNGTMRVINSTVSGNAVTGGGVADGGGAFDIFNASTVLIVNSTIANNTAVQAARSGIWQEGGR